MACLLLLLICSLTAVGFANGQVSSDEPQTSIRPLRRGGKSIPADRPDTVLRVASALVLIPVHVTTVAGTSVVGLKKDDFELYEDGVAQPVASFFTQDAPISIGLLLDTSASMKNKMEKASQAAEIFFHTANPEDEFFLVEFSGRAKLAVPFTPDANEVYQRIAHTKPFGQTPLFDAIHLALKEMKSARNSRKALVILSDGGDNWSRYSARAIRSALLESDVQVYAMGIFDPDYMHNHPAEERRGPLLLDDLAAQTGGRHFPVADLEELPAISARIGEELRHEYVLGYYPQNQPEDGKYHGIKVKVQAPNGTAEMRTYYRHGYFAPGP